MNENPQNQKTKPPIHFWFWGLIIVFLVSAGISAYLAFSAIRDASSKLDLGGMPPQADIQEPKPTPIQVVEQFLDVTIPLQSESGPQPQPWDGESRMTILLLGVDSRNVDSNNDPSLTDTIILVTLDPKTQTAGMLSIPPDLWIEVPHHGYHKINQAYALGEADHLAGGGPSLAISTVEELMDIDIPYYALIDFKAFIHLIDKIGGIIIDIPESIEVDTLVDEKNQILEPGLQILSGDLTLAYVRARNTPGNDFDRAARQQEIILAVQEQVIDIDFIPTLIAEAPNIYEEVATGVKTNLNLLQTVQIAWLAVQIPQENIKQKNIGAEQVVFDVSSQGWDILQPIPGEIYKLADELFSSGLSPSPSKVANLEDDEKAIEEDARVELRNGTFTVGLAAQTAAYLQANNLIAMSVSNADQVYTNSTIIVYTGKPYTVDYLSKLLHIPQSKIFHRFDPESEVDILVILGEDWAENNNMP